MKTSIPTLMNFAMATPDERTRTLATAALVAFHEGSQCSLEGNGQLHFQILRAAGGWKVIVTYQYGNQSRHLIAAYRPFSKKSKRLFQQGGFISSKTFARQHEHYRKLSQKTCWICRVILDRAMARVHKWLNIRFALNA